MDIPSRADTLLWVTITRREVDPSCSTANSPRAKDKREWGNFLRKKGVPHSRQEKNGRYPLIPKLAGEDLSEGLSQPLRNPSTQDYFQRNRTENEGEIGEKPGNSFYLILLNTDYSDWIKPLRGKRTDLALTC
jgi:hypothetical protein